MDAETPRADDVLSMMVKAQARQIEKIQAQIQELVELIEEALESRNDAVGKAHSK
jgi:hypothetical protein